MQKEELKIKYFGLLAEQTGKAEETIIISEKSTVSDIMKIIFLNHPELKNLKFEIALNKVIKKENSVLKNGDELALLPPFAGG